MNKEETCSVFMDLYDLYVDEELEPETMKWMREMESECMECLSNKQENNMAVFVESDHQKIWEIRVLMAVLYGFFIFLSIWMSVWYFW